MQSNAAQTVLGYEAVKAAIYRIKRYYPFVSCRVCARSVAGRAIFVLSVGNRRDPALYIAGVHGCEHITSTVLLKFFENVCYCVSKNRELCSVPLAAMLAVRGIVIVPCVNPDGVEISLRSQSAAGCMAGVVRDIGGVDCRWKANARGVDINHNFNAGWHLLHEAEKREGICRPSPARWGGEAPESEPETAAMVSLCRSVRPRHALALHSQGEEIFWRYGENMPERSEMLAKIFCAVSGYSLAENAGLYAHGGFKDWFISEFERPAFTIEVGKGENPLPPQDAGKIYNDIEPLLVTAAVL